MTGSLFDSPLYSGLFPTAEMRRLFTDSAAIRAMLLVEGALAKVQGELGVIPELSAAAIHRASLEITIDPAALAKATAKNGVPVPALVAAFRAEMNAPEHSQFVHWGATSQDIMDTALMLRLRQALILLERDVRTVLLQLADLSETHAATPMAARTWGQHATPTSFGAVVATWGAPLLDLLEELPAIRARSLLASLSGATGTASALGPNAPEQRRALATALGLEDPKRSWHTDRGPVLALAGWMTRCTVALGKLAEDAGAMLQSEVSELVPGATGFSSTMPQKQNPVVASVIVSLCQQVCAANGVLHRAGVHRFQRDGAAWFTEWAVLPQIVLGTAAAAAQAAGLTETLAPNEKQMRALVDAGQGLIFAEALSFALAKTMPRPEAQAAVKALCNKAIAEQAELRDLALAAYPQLDATLFSQTEALGQAPADARAFAARCR